MIDVREAMSLDEPIVETMVNAEPDKESAFNRADSLKRCFYDISNTVNGSDRANVPDKWHKKYANLTKALMDCISCEEEIISRR